MTDKPFAIGIFVSAPSIDESLRKLAVQSDCVLKVSYASLDEALKAAREMEREGVEVIISRRGTANMLRENLRVPVLSFPHSTVSVLASIRAAAAKGHRIFLPSFRNKRSGMEFVDEIFGVHFEQGTYTDSQTLREIIHKAAREGFEVVIGGAATMRFAAEAGIKYCELTSSEEEVAETIENAKSVAQSQREQKEMAQRYQTILDSASYGIIAVDRKGRITTINSTGEQLLGINIKEAIGDRITRLLPKSGIERVLDNSVPVRDKIERIKEETFLFNYNPVVLDGEVVGAVCAFQAVSNVMSAEKSVRRSLSKGFVAKYDLEDLIYRSSAMSKLVELCKAVAKTDSGILLTGETGTGKEIIAQSIHNLSRRKAKPFVFINCAALPEQLLESELFGYEEGAFTGSKRGGKPGLFELAHEGTIFLDEIDSTTPGVQLRLLRVLQESEVRRIGAESTVPINVRVIAAAGRDLWSSVQEGAFRKDLFFRLNVLRIIIPPLRDRREDIAALLEHFLERFAIEHGTEKVKLPGPYVKKLVDYSWPGNVRQLRHFAEQLLLTCTFQCGEGVLDNLFSELSRIVEKENSPSPGSSEPLRGVPAILAPEASLFLPRNRIDEQIIKTAMDRARFNKSRAAQMLGISRTTLWRRLKEYGLE